MSHVARLDVSLSVDEIAALAEEAYLYAYPILVGYGFFYRQALDPQAPDRQSLNTFTHFRTLASPTVNNRIPWINTDTMNSACWLDLRAEPMVLTTPLYEAFRFQGIQLNDWYTMTFCTRSTRDRGNGPGTYLIVGPDWRGEKPAFADEVLRAESWIVKLFTRVLVEGSDDIAAIHALQDKLSLRRMSAVLGAPAPAPADDLHTLLPNPAPGGGYGFFTCPTPDFIGFLNTLLTIAAIHPSEAAMFERFSRLGIRPGAAFHAGALDDARRDAVQHGINVALGKIDARIAALGDPVNGWVYPLDLRGGRDVLASGADAYLRRAVLAKYAIWGPPAEEVVYMTCDVDSEARRLDGAARYTLLFDLPVPARGFWSFTVYDAETRLLVTHPSGRYKRGDRDRDMAPDANGVLTLYLQHDDPGPAHRANWLPTPSTPFQVVARLYWPDPEVLSRAYAPPPIVRMR